MRDYKVSVVIPTYNTWKLTQGLLDGLSRHESENVDEILVVDDCSPISPDLASDLPFTILGLAKNSGFPITCNTGLQQVTKDRFAEKRAVFLVSNDVVVNGKFIEQTAEILFGAKRSFVGNRHITFDSGWNQFNGVVYDYLEGFFLACTSDGWRDLGYFDEQFAPMDYEDVDISTTAKKKGYKLVSLNNPNIIHIGGGTYGYTEARRIQTEKNREVFKRKWTQDT